MDWSDITSPMFKFTLEIINGSNRMITEYSGGYLAFVDKTRLEHHLKFNTIHKPIMEGLTKGLKFKYNPSDKKCKATECINYLLSISNVNTKDVLYCLLSDMDCGDMSFQDFCDDLGYNSDSIKDLGVYNACVTNGREFRKVMGKDLETVRLALQDY